MQLNRAVAIAREAVEGGADWIEAGTPLIKSEGAEAVRALRREFPSLKIIADTKTMDTGSFEVEIMAKAGADIVTVLGLADDATIEEAVMAGRKYGAEVMVDLINVPDRVARAKRVQELGVEKRDPRAFSLALEQLGERPEACALYEDSPSVCRTAKEAGLTVVGVYDPFYAHYEDQMRAFCHRYIRSFTELL